MSSLMRILIFVCASGGIVALSVVRKRKSHHLWLKRIKFKKISLQSDIGRCFGADIGGSLTKLVYFEQRNSTSFMRRPRSLSHDLAFDEMQKFVFNAENYGNTGKRDSKLSVYAEHLGGTFHFIRFESRRMTQVVDTIAQSGLNQSVRNLSCTGGGSFKCKELFQDQAGIELNSCDEIDCTIKGLNFMLELVPNEVFTFEDVDFRSMSARSKRHPERQNSQAGIYPYLLVSIGSGVSVLKVDSPTEYTRVSGSSIGGGTFWGLCKSLTECQTYDDAMHLSENGNNFGVDMSVGDIYGGAYDKFDLPATTVASSFGKVAPQQDPENTVHQSDIARSLLIMITQNIGQVAYLNACLAKTNRIIFVGNFLRHNKISCRTLAYAIHFWSKGKMEAQFCRHEGYLGALGAFLYNADLRRVDPQ